ncbi:hypothetical protein M0813_13934 [Anaeramoeba flamelloides]|uniref:MD-2-related lipid-recognition domain-containing protein n=1 Tax=Anaeramoeba flamelloides TaxID=1746091 RepID=A0ABQ8Z772_9EUKA|nr:hypothetical protein M0813_13934 [Anaeramoeba flamelloides]
MFRLFLISLILVSSVFSQEWEICDKTIDYELTLQNVTISPDPPRVGRDVTIKLEGELIKIVDGGSVNILIKYDGTTIYNRESELCSDPDDFPCPHPQGKVKFHKSLQIPSFAPAGTYSGQISITDQDNDAPIICFKYDMPVVN